MTIIVVSVMSLFDLNRDLTCILSFRSYQTNVKSQCFKSKSDLNTGSKKVICKLTDDFALKDLMNRIVFPFRLSIPT